MIHRIFAKYGVNYRLSAAFLARRICLTLGLALGLTFATASAWAIDVLADVPQDEPAAINVSAAESVPVDASLVQTEQVRAQLLLDAPEGWQVGKPVRVGLKLQHSPGWHTYWRNSGDSGAPVELQWHLPAGAQAGDLAWPLPQRIPVADMVNYGYTHDVILSAPITITQAPKDEEKISLDAKWLVCSVTCVPQQGHFELPVPKSSVAAHHAEFEQNLRAVPEDLGEKQVLSASIDGQDLLLQGDASAWGMKPGQMLTVFAQEPQYIAHAAAGAQHWQGAHWSLRLPFNAALHTAPAQTFWVLSDGVRAVRIPAQMEAGNIAKLKASALYQRNTAGMTVSPALQAALDANAQSGKAANPASQSTSMQGGLLWALLLAVLGGAALNLMPCVFPVLALKVLGFVQASSVAARRRGALAYAAGVVLSFVILAAILLALKAGGSALGWGFQLQSAWFLAALALLFTLLALSMSGGLQLRAFLPQRWLNASSHHPLVDSFLSGVLAVAVASPCTAPLMGAALGFALAQSAAVALAVFVALGLGMALPYVLLAYAPKFSALLPKPGVWMDAFKRLLALPLWLTVVWLLWVLGQQLGIDAAMLLLAGLVFAVNIIWLWFEKTYRRTAIVVAFLLLFCLWLFQKEISTSFTIKPMNSQESAQTAWQAWSPERQAQLVAAGQPVFVDYTAAWCVTCQYNKKAVLDQADIQAAFAQKKVHLLLADWTRYDPAITAALQKLGRSGLPVYVLINAQGQQTLLPELLDKAAVLDALQQL